MELRSTGIKGLVAVFLLIDGMAHQRRHSAGMAKICCVPLCYLLFSLIDSGGIGQKGDVNGYILFIFVNTHQDSTVQHNCLRRHITDSMYSSKALRIWQITAKTSLRFRFNNMFIS